MTMMIAADAAAYRADMGAEQTSDGLDLGIRLRADRRRRHRGLRGRGSEQHSSCEGERGEAMAYSID